MAFAVMLIAGTSFANAMNVEEDDLYGYSKADHRIPNKETREYIARIDFQNMAADNHSSICLNAAIAMSTWREENGEREPEIENYYEAAKEYAPTHEGTLRRVQGTTGSAEKEEAIEMLLDLLKEEDKGL